jgi:hypothetical protein
MEDKPYTVHSPTKITLSPEAKYWAEQHGLSLEEMARYLLVRDKLEGDEQTTIHIGDIADVKI